MANLQKVIESEENKKNAPPQEIELIVEKKEEEAQACRSRGDCNRNQGCCQGYCKLVCTYGQTVTQHEVAEATNIDEQI